MKLQFKYNIDSFDVLPDYIEKQVSLVNHGKYSQGRITIRNTFIGKKVLVVLMSQQNQSVAPKGMMRASSNEDTEPFYDILETEVKEYAYQNTRSGVIFAPASFGKNMVRIYFKNVPE